jgi:8-oxo-dGTP pyrophosphatase MutT (NUDIX family)
MGKRRIRPLALCVFRRGHRILVAEGFDDAKGERFFRPLGGRIEFGETAAQAVHREIREELGAECADLRFLGLLESIFVYNGEPAHELVLVFDGRLVDDDFGEGSRPVALTADGQDACQWIDIADPPGRLHPEGLREMLVEDIERKERRPER